MNPALEVLFIVLLLIANGVLSMSEIAILSAKKARLQKLAEEGNANAKTALAMATEPNQLLSTVQIGITLVGILAGAFGGAAIADNLAGLIGSVGFLAPYSNALGMVIVVAVITYLSVLVGELVPKRIALNNAEAIACAVAKPMNLISRLAAPVVYVLSFSTEMLLKLLRIRPSEDPAVTEEDVKILIRQGTQIGTFEATEQNIVERLFRLSDRQAASLMTPRSEIVFIDIDEPVETSFRMMAESGHSYFPVFEGTRDHVVGLASIKALWAKGLEQQQQDLRTGLMKPLFVPAITPALKLLDIFEKEATHIALVIDEYGGVQGMLTLNDVLGAIVGDVAYYDSLDEPQSLKRDDGSWLLDGMLSIEECKELLQIQAFPDESPAGYKTVGGMMMAYLGRLPKVGDAFVWENFKFEVMDMDGRRIDKVWVRPL